MSTDQTRSRARRAEPEPNVSPAPNHVARLVKGLRYDLLAKPGLWPDQAFLANQEVEVSAEVFDHLAEHALDKVAFRSGNDMVTQQVRKFRLQAPDGSVMPKIAIETVTPIGGAEPEIDPYV